MASESERKTKAQRTVFPACLKRESRSFYGSPITTFGDDDLFARVKQGTLPGFFPEVAPASQVSGSDSIDSARYAWTASAYG